MDNLKYYNDSLAYDFEMFMPKKKEESYEPKVADAPKMRVRKGTKSKAAAKKVSLSAFAVLVAFIMLAVLFANLFLRLKINEVNSNINDLKSEINVLDSEKNALLMEYEERISYSNLETEAAELGMNKMDKSQVKYIRVNDQNTATTEDGTTVSEK